MYKFRDTIAAASVDDVLPSEALLINGAYIEEQITGYRTLYVSGREALSPELDSYETGIRDGSVLKSRRYPPRKITIGYQLIAASNNAFREAYNTLAGILDVQDAQLIFRDEPDKYFTGTPSKIRAVDPGTNAVTGEFEITCHDPFKYSMDEHEATLVEDENGLSFVIDYAGTAKSFPTLEADFWQESEVSEDGETAVDLTGDGDCGYVAFFNDREKIIQLGDPEEEDGEDMAKSQTLVYQTFTNSKAWGSAAKNKWSANNSVVSDSSIITQTGSYGMALMNSEDYYLTPASYGSGAKYHGPSIARTIPADAADESGAANFTFSIGHKMAIGSGKNDTKQRGAFQVQLTDADGFVIAGFNIYKSSTGKTAKLRCYANGKVLKTQDIDLSYNNKHFGNNNSKITAKKLSVIQKEGKKLTFTIGCVKNVFTIPAIADLKVHEIHITTTGYGSYTPLKFNGFRWCKFVKHNCTTWREVLNKFSTGDVLTADCRNGEILLNDSPKPELGALGNDWEEFYLVPGLNQIGVSYSDWVADDYAPTFKVKYREVFL